MYPARMRISWLAKVIPLLFKNSKTPFSPLPRGRTLTTQGGSKVSMPQEGPSRLPLRTPLALPVNVPKPRGGWQETLGTEGVRNKVRQRKFKNRQAFPVSLSYLFNLLLLVWV